MYKSHILNEKYKKIPARDVIPLAGLGNKLNMVLLQSLLI